MERKNSLLLSIVAVATLLITVVGATFAYFSATIQGNNTSLNFQATTGSKASFIVTPGTGMVMNITGAQMLESAVNNTVPKGNVSDTLKVQLTGDANSSCTYDIVYTDSSTTKYAQACANEFTVEGSSSPNVGALDVTSYGTYSSASNKAVLSNITISTGNSTSATQTWTFNFKFYNLDCDQSSLANKTYKGNFKVTNVRC